MPRPPRPDDLYAPPGRDAYRSSLWLVPADGSAPACRLTLGARRDTAPPWSPDARTLAFLSDRAAVLTLGGAGDRVPPAVVPGTPSVRKGEVQIWLSPLDGGEATQLTCLPEDVTDLAWSPDGARLCVLVGVDSLIADGLADPIDWVSRAARAVAV